VIKHISTGDGSSSFYIEELKETYHSKHGAIQESKHVFIDQGMAYLGKNSQKILEVGMGTGLNVLLAAEYALQRKIKTNLTTLEPFPIDADLISKVNYADKLSSASAASTFSLIHSSRWETEIKLNDYLSFTKHKVKLEEFKPKIAFDLFFYDAFGPHAQPELWAAEVFRQLAEISKKGTVLVTYCAQGQFKRNLKAAGFSVERLPGPPGKREMTRGTFLGH